jgi:nicotinamidase-related amidase
MLARRAASQLVLVDIQEKLAPHVDGHAAIIRNAARLIAYATRLGVPVTVTEHYPQGIGATTRALAGLLGNGMVRIEKNTFSAWQTPDFKSRVDGLRRAGRHQIVIAGMEAHVCVLQTALDLLAADFEVLLVADAAGSRRAEDRQLALNRLDKAGAAIVTHEMIAFEWLERCATPEFKDLIGVIK